MASELPAACTSLPPVVVEGYVPKGKYETFNGLKTYITGSTSAKIAIIYIYDIFGYCAADYPGSTDIRKDIVASSLDAIVLLPDTFDGGVDPQFFSVPPEARAEAMGIFFGEGGAGYAPKVVKQINDTARALSSAYPSVEKIGGIGLCYGGKVIILAANEKDSPIQAGAQGHPSKLAKEDAEALRGPHLILASDGESKEDVDAFDKVEKPKGSETHTYHGMHHGWMGARAKFDEDKFREGYQKAYAQTVEWFRTVLA